MIISLSLACLTGEVRLFHNFLLWLRPPIAPGVTPLSRLMIKMESDAADSVLPFSQLSKSFTDSNERMSLPNFKKEVIIMKKKAKTLKAKTRVRAGMAGVDQY